MGDEFVKDALKYVNHELGHNIITDIAKANRSKICYFSWIGHLWDQIMVVAFYESIVMLDWKMSRTAQVITSPIVDLNYWQSRQYPV